MAHLLGASVPRSLYKSSDVQCPLLSTSALLLLRLSLNISDRASCVSFGEEAVVSLPSESGESIFFNGCSCLHPVLES